MKNRQLKKSSKNKSLHGVCGGIAEFFTIPTFAVRLIFIVIPIPVSLFIYIILANSLPDSPQTL